MPRHAEWLGRWLGCLEDHGATVERDPDGGFRTVPQGGPLYGICFNEYPEPTWASLTRDEIAWRYDANVAAAACLEAHGLTVPDPPSREAYIDDYLVSFTTGVAPWTPYVAVDGRDELWDACPEPRVTQRSVD